MLACASSIHPLVGGRGSRRAKRNRLAKRAARSCSRTSASAARRCSPSAARSRRIALLLECDFLPDEKREALEQRLANHLRVQGGKQIGNANLLEVPARLWSTLLAQAQIAAETRSAELSKDARRKLIDGLKATRIRISGTRGFAKAEVTAGGVDLREVDSSTMQSKLAPGLFFAGEVLDLDGPIGGYNFQAAFSTGWLAGESVP